MVHYRSSCRFTNRREENLKKAFPFINFKFEYAICSYYGLGDYPQFKIPGVLKKTGQSVLYRTTHPGGGSPSLRIFTKGEKDLIFANASQSRAKKIGRKLSKINQRKYKK